MTNFTVNRISISILIFEHANIIDVTGPAGVFSAATALLNAPASATDVQSGYEIRFLAEAISPVQTDGGLRLLPDATLESVTGPVDTLIVPGGTGARDLKHQRGMISWLHQVVPHTRRPCSVCTGAFLLAEAGVLDGRKVVTHWDHCETLSQHYPSLTVDPDPIFIADGKFHTSAGVTAGMDMALALVEEDFGHEIAIATARQLVMDYKRPGGQSQFSDRLTSQLSAGSRFSGLLSWVYDNPGKDLRVDTLAEQAAMSPRNFVRVFSSETGQTPAKFVEKIRLDLARTLLSGSRQTISRIADTCGFGNAERMRRTFHRHLTTSPENYRKRFSAQCGIGPFPANRKEPQ